MNRHDALILAVVGLVAVFAVVSMVRLSGAAPVEESRTFIPVVGAATAEVRYSDRVPARVHDVDFTGDGWLTLEDSDLLAMYITEQRCPRDKMCDLNGDGVLDLRDLELFNALISPMDAPVRVSPSPVVRRAPSSVGSRLA